MMGCPAVGTWMAPVTIPSDTVGDDVAVLPVGDDRPLQAAAHTVEVLGHGVDAGEEGVDALPGEPVLLGAQHHPDFPEGGGLHLPLRMAALHVGKRRRRGTEADGVALGQAAALEAPHLVLQGGAPAAHDLRYVQPPGEGNVAPAAPLDRPQGQLVPRRDGEGPVHGAVLPVELGLQRRAGDGHHVGGGKAEGGAQNGHLQGALLPAVAHQEVGDLKGGQIHGAGGRHAEALIAEASPVLDGGQDAGLFYHKAHVIPPFRRCGTGTPPAPPAA